MTAEPLMSTCDLCFATVDHSLMHFHRTWHDDQHRAAPRLFEVGEIDRTVAELMSTVEQLRSVPEVHAQEAFVARLRDRLIAEALEDAINDVEGSSAS